MAEIDVTVAGRSFRLGCDDGQEGHLAALAASLDAEARAISAKGGLVAEGKLLLMAALIIADRVSDAEAARDAALAERDQLRAALDRAEPTDELDALRADIAAAQLEAASARAGRDEAQAASETARAALDALHAERDALSAERDALSAELAAARAEAEAARAEAREAARAPAASGQPGFFDSDDAASALAAAAARLEALAARHDPATA